MNTKKKIIFFNGLNELRAIAALAVIFHHIELYKHDDGMNSLYSFNHFSQLFISKLGKNGVLLFFVLSGFLITYLLLEEKFKTGKISVSKFYGRRILRIWPLYFIILIIGFFIVPEVYYAFPDFFQNEAKFNSRITGLVYGNNLLLYLFFFSNIAGILYGPVVGASQSWSVSVEEQFYLVWPWFIKLFSKKILLALVCILCFSNFIIYIFPNSILKTVIVISKIEYMSMGAIIAYVYRNNKNFVISIFKSKAFVLVLIFSIILHLFYDITTFSKSLTFGLLILSFIEKRIAINSLDYLGKLSYGIYMYHPVVMYMCFAFLNQFKIESIFLYNILIYPIILFITFIISYFSYNYIELYFLKKKKKFSPVLSGNI